MVTCDCAARDFGRRCGASSCGASRMEALACRRCGRHAEARPWTRDQVRSLATPRPRSVAAALAVCGGRDPPPELLLRWIASPLSVEPLHIMAAPGRALSTTTATRNAALVQQYSFEESKRRFRQAMLRIRDAYLGMLNSAKVWRRCARTRGARRPHPNRRCQVSDHENDDVAGLQTAAHVESLVRAPLGAPCLIAPSWLLGARWWPPARSLCLTSMGDLPCRFRPCTSRWSTSQS